VCDTTNKLTCTSVMCSAAVGRQLTRAQREDAETIAATPERNCVGLMLATRRWDCYRHQRPETHRDLQRTSEPSDRRRCFAAAGADRPTAAAAAAAVRIGHHLWSRCGAECELLKKSSSYDVAILRLQRRPVERLLVIHSSPSGRGVI